MSFIINPYRFANFPMIDSVGTNDAKRTGMTSAVSSSQGIFSVWLRRQSGGSSDDYLFRTQNGGGSGLCEIYLAATNNRPTVILRQPTGALDIFVDGTTGISADDDLHHLLMSWDTNFSDGNKLFKMYLDDVSIFDSISDGGGAFSVPWNNANETGVLTYGASGITQGFNGCVAEFYLNTDDYLDFDTEANRRKFIKSDGSPVADLGATGSDPTGLQPAIYLKAPAAGFTTNLGYAGNFTAVSAFTNCA